MTFNQLILRLFSLVSLAILVAGGWLTAEYFDRLYGTGAAPIELLWWGGGLLGASFLGGPVMTFMLGRGGDLHGRYERGEGRMLDAPDGARLWVESSGDADAPALVLTHGWGLDSTVWREAKRELSRRYRVIVWDLPGLGRSKLAPDGKLAMDRLAENLWTVAESAGGPVVLVGHSIGGMIIQELMRRRPEAIGSKIAGAALQNTTFTDPTRTTLMGGALHALEGPLLRPLMKLEVMLSPLVGLMNWQAYLSGWMQLGQRLGGFGPAPCRTLLDHVSRLACRNSAGVQAKGVLAMMDWDQGGSNQKAMAAVRAEAVVFTGGHDLVTQPWAGTHLAETLGAHENRVGFAGHYGPIECPSWYDHALLAFADHVLMKGAVWADRVASGPEAASAAARGESEGRSWAPGPPRAGLQPM